MKRYLAGQQEVPSFKIYNHRLVVLVKCQVYLEPRRCSVSSCDLQTKPPFCEFLHILCKLSGDVVVKVDNRQYNTIKKERDCDDVLQSYTHVC